MKINNPINLKSWIEEHRHLLKPPVGNQQIYKDNKDFIVMVVGGPNSRKDFHVNAGEELFYQLENDIILKVIENDIVKEILIAEGDLFLLPPRVPHLPLRPANTIGLVIERHRPKEELDGFLWYCENCNNKLYEEYIQVSDIVRQLPIVMQSFYSSVNKRTCKVCMYVMEPPM